LTPQKKKEGSTPPQKKEKGKRKEKLRKKQGVCSVERGKDEKLSHLQKHKNRKVSNYATFAIEASNLEMVATCSQENQILSFYDVILSQICRLPCIGGSSTLT